MLSRPPPALSATVGLEDGEGDFEITKDGDVLVYTNAFGYAHDFRGSARRHMGRQGTLPSRPPPAMMATVGLEDGEGNAQSASLDNVLPEGEVAAEMVACR